MSSLRVIDHRLIFSDQSKTKSNLCRYRFLKRLSNNGFSTIFFLFFSILQRSQFSFLGIVKGVNSLIRPPLATPLVYSFFWLVGSRKALPQPNISAIFPVAAKYPIAPRNNPKAISFGTIPPMI